MDPSTSIDNTFSWYPGILARHWKPLPAPPPVGGRGGEGGGSPPVWGLDDLFASLDPAPDPAAAAAAGGPAAPLPPLPSLALLRRAVAEVRAGARLDRLQTPAPYTLSGLSMADAQARAPPPA